MALGLRVRRLREELARKGVRLVLVSKGRPPEKIIEAYQHGQRDFGESRVQELLTKYERLPKDIRWHMIGHLQRNKAKYIASFVYLVHSVDSLNLLRVLNEEAQKVNRLLPCLVQVRLSNDSLKKGFSAGAVEDFFSAKTHENYPNISLLGLMGMLSHTKEAAVLSRECTLLRKLFLACKADFYTHPLFSHELSVGMTNDYPIAIQKGSTMVRIGRLIFSPDAPSQ